jgi:hypothetical protein
MKIDGVKKLKSCPVVFNHRGNSYDTRNMSPESAMRLALDPSFPHIVKAPKRAKKESEASAE